jgi:hypothetical protein
VLEANVASKFHPSLIGVLRYAFAERPGVPQTGVCEWSQIFRRCAMKRFWRLIAALVLIVVSLAGCGPAPASVVLTEKDNGRTVELPVNARLDIELPAPRFDYHWDFEVGSTEPGELIWVAVKPHSEHNFGNRTERFGYTTMATGTKTLRYVYRPANDFNGTPIDTFEFILKVHR